MIEKEWLAQRFEENRAHLRAVAYRMLGSLGEADDAVQEAWLRLSRSDAGEIENLGGWLTTVVARVSLDLLRSRKSRHEESIEAQTPEVVMRSKAQPDPEQELVMADSVGLALLVLLDRLTPAERLAFVLHDMFALSFEEIGPIVGRTPTAARQLASRARRRVQGVSEPPSGDLVKQRKIANAFLAALRLGDFDGLIAVLDPDVIVQLDAGAGAPGAPREIHGAENWARGALAFARAARFIQPTLINGSVGLVWAPRGRLLRAMEMRTANGKIIHVHVIADPARLRELDLAILDV
jgi:RNA polymerase sigma factor (sigma-70 family)